MARRLARALAWTVAVLAALVLVVAVVPALRSDATAVEVLAASAGRPLPWPFAHGIAVRRDVRLTAPGGGAVAGDLYVPGGGGPAVVLVPGAASPQDRRVIDVATAFARAGRTVFVPYLSLSRRVLDPADVGRIGDAVLALARAGGQGRGGRVGLLGFSYGGSLAIVAAEHRPAARSVAFVAVFGSYANLVDVIQGITTGGVTYRGRIVRWRTLAPARGLLLDAVLGLVPAGERAALRAAVDAGTTAGLSPEARSLAALLENRDPGRTASLVRALPARVRALIAAVSPLPRLQDLRAPLYILQSVHDPATPPTEADLLHAGVPGSRLIVLHEFLHVTPEGAGKGFLGAVADLWGAWRFTGWVLGAE